MNREEISNNMQCGRTYIKERKTLRNIDDLIGQYIGSDRRSSGRRQYMRNTKNHTA